MKSEIEKLRKKRDKLLKLAMKNRKMQEEIMMKQKESLKLRSEIAQLKAETGKSLMGLIKKYKRVKESPKAKYYVKKAKVIGSALQRFANKYGTK